MACLRREHAGIMAGIRRLDAEKALEAIVGKVAEGFRFFAPRIPDHGGEAVFLRDRDFSAPGGIMKGEGVTRFIIDPIKFLREDKRVARSWQKYLG